MSYLSGLALGISAGHQLNGLLCSQGFRLVHSLPGRRRYHHEDLLNNPKLARRWERQLPKIPGLKKVHFSPLSGNILIEYTCADDYIDILVNFLEQIHKIPEPHDHYGRLGADIRRAFYRINRNIFKSTNRILDLRTLLAVCFTIWGGAKMWATGQRPTGSQMIWWAYTLLRGRD